MIVKRSGGMTEFIPSPSEKRDGVIRDHVLDLLANLDARLRAIEEAVDADPRPAEEFSRLTHLIQQEEAHIRMLNDDFREAGRVDAGDERVQSLL